jgi:hypothetical protein
LDRAGLLRAIARAREAKVMTEDHARTLTGLIDIVDSPQLECLRGECPSSTGDHRLEKGGPA